MDKITLYSTDKTQSVTMPRVKSISVGAEEVSNAVTMASGKVVKDMIGYRNTVTATWDYVPATTITALMDLLRSGGFFYAEYPSPQGDESGIFQVSYPDMEIFAFQNGIPVWHNVTLKLTAQEVT